MGRNFVAICLTEYHFKGRSDVHERTGKTKLKFLLVFYYFVAGKILQR